jgi:hypothetical protein
LKFFVRQAYNHFKPLRSRSAFCFGFRLAFCS